MSWATVFLIAGVFFLVAWAYQSAKQHREDDVLEEDESMIVRSQRPLEEGITNLTPPDVFDESRIKSDLARLASTPGALGKYIAQAQIRFKQARQIQVLNRWAEFYHAGEAVIRARTELARAHSELKQVDIEADVKLKEKDARIADLEADTAESHLRAAEARKKLDELHKPPEKKLTAEEERVLMKAKIEGNLTRLRNEKGQELSKLEPSDEDERMHIENIYDDRIAREKEELSKYL